MKETVGKQELVKRIAEQTEITQKQAGEILDATLTTIKQALQEGQDIRLIGFGSFAVRQAAARTAINCMQTIELYTGQFSCTPDNKDVHWKNSSLARAYSSELTSQALSLPVEER